MRLLIFVHGKLFPFFVDSLVHSARIIIKATTPGVLTPDLGFAVPFWGSGFFH